MHEIENIYGQPWSTLEFLIVLNAYFESTEKSWARSSPIVTKLSRMLGRTPPAVVMRLENFASLDPRNIVLKHGLRNIGHRGKALYNEWAVKRQELRAIAQVYEADVTERNPSLFAADVTHPKPFGKYEVFDQIGEGAFGRVFSCVEIQTGQVFALKVLKREAHADEDAFGRFVREMKALSSVRHENIVAIYDCDFEGPVPAYVMELADRNLTTLIQDALPPGSNTRLAVSPEQAMSIITQTARAVQVLHDSSAQIVHRDVNPNNILLMPDGRYVLSDFGLAKFLTPSQMTTTGYMTTTRNGWGTAFYAAPEQYQDFRLTNERTDIYALGMLVWELFSAKWPPPEYHDPGLTGKMRELFTKACAREQADRYQTVGAFIDALVAAYADFNGKDPIHRYE